MTTNFMALILLYGFFLGLFLIVLFSWLEDRLGWRSRAGQLLLPLLFGVMFLFYLDGAMDGDRGEQIMRAQLNIPADVSLKKLNRGKKHSVCYHSAARYRAITQFSPEQFSRFLESTSNRELWQPVLPDHYDPERSSFDFAADALQWSELPEPPYHGSQQLVWRFANTDIRRGLAFCYDINPRPGLTTKNPNDLSTAYFVTPCNAIGRSKTPRGGGRVQAALDFDKQQLMIAMHFDSKPYYCNNRVTKWVGERLAFDTN